MCGKEDIENVMPKTVSGHFGSRSWLEFQDAIRRLSVTKQPCANKDYSMACRVSTLAACLATGFLGEGVAGASLRASRANVTSVAPELSSFELGCYMNGGTHRDTLLNMVRQERRLIDTPQIKCSKFTKTQFYVLGFFS